MKGGGGGGLVVGGWANFNYTCKRESHLDKRVNRHEGCWYHRCPDHDSRKCSAQLGSSWVLAGSDLFTIKSSFDQDDEGQVSGQ